MNCVEIFKSHSCIVSGYASMPNRCGSLNSELCFVQYYRKGFRTFFDLLEEVLRKGSGFHVAWFSAIAWSLWQRRNRLRENQSVWPLHEIGARAKDLVTEFLDATK